MAKVVDELVTEYIGVDKNSNVAEKIAKNNERLHGVIQKVIAAFVALQATDKLFAFSDKAQEAAKSYEELNSRLIAIVGSADSAARKLKLVEAVAGPSPFTTKQLADAAVMLEAFGVNSERALPIIGRLGAAFGAGDEQIQMFSRALGELGQGNFIDADVLAAMGLSRRDFAGQGIKFDGSGKLLSSATDTMTALETIVNDRFGDIFNQMANTAVAKAASLDDAIEKVMRSVGNGILRAQGPFNESWTKVLGALVNSGVLDEVVTKLTKAFNGVFGGDTSVGVAKFAAKTLAFLDALPEHIQKIGKFFNDLGKSIADSFVSAFNFVGEKAMWLFNFLEASVAARLNPILDIVNKVGKFLHMDTNIQRLEATPLPYKRIESMSEIFTSVGIKFPKFDTGKRENEIYQRLLKSMSSPANTIPDNRNLPFLNRVSENDKVFNKIMEHTERTAKAVEQQVDLSRFLFGGGDMAKKGISLLDVTDSRVQSGQQGPAQVVLEFKPPRDSFERAMNDTVSDILRQLIRGGFIRAGEF